MAEEDYSSGERRQPPKYFIDSVGKKILVRSWEHLRELEERDKRYQGRRAEMDERGN